MNAPVALFVYNRPEHTRRVLQHLKRNELAAESTLYIFCDGPKANATAADKKKINEVRELALSENWCGKVIVNMEETNKGVNKSIIDGITEIVNRYSKIIVVEDDIITSKYFLRFMNEALIKYANNEKIMSVSGYWFPIRVANTKPFFLCTGVGWGWGTWSHAWNKYTLDSKQLIEQIEKKKLVKNFNLDGSYDFFGLLEANQKGIISGWDADWYATIFLNDGVALFPPVSFTTNIGTDGTGTHFSNVTSQFRHQEGHLDAFDRGKYAIEFPEIVSIDEAAGKKMNAYLKGNSRNDMLKKIQEKIQIITGRRK